MATILLYSFCFKIIYFFFLTFFLINQICLGSHFNYSVVMSGCNFKLSNQFGGDNELLQVNIGNF